MQADVELVDLRTRSATGCAAGRAASDQVPPRARRRPVAVSSRSCVTGTSRSRTRDRSPRRPATRDSEAPAEILAQHRQVGAGGTGDAAGADVPQDRHEPKAARKYRPFHLVAEARPSSTPAASRQGRKPRPGVVGGRARPGARGRPRRPAARPRAGPGPGPGRSAGSRRRPARRTSRPGPAARCGSSRSAGRPPPAARPPGSPANVERNSRRPMRHSISTDRVPEQRRHEAPAERGAARRVHSPRPMTHLPTGGCTT